MPQRLRIFVSSPTDVPDERLRADLIVDRLSQDYSRFFTIESYRWEHEAMIASKHFQDAIEPPSAFDIVVLILWSRLGTPRPEKTAEREYRGIDGRAPVTGTEWEYEEALKGAREKGAPDLLAFRNISPAPVDTRDPEARARSNEQLDALDKFWRRHFADRGVFRAAYDEYHSLGEFAQRLEQSLRKLIERRIKTLAEGASRDEPIWPGDPFRGLESYEFEHAPIFFGRDASIMKATEQLAANARAGCAFLLVSGASGSGKSSLVKAGMVPRLMKPQRISGIGFLRRAVLRPAAEGSDVFLALAMALARAAQQDSGLPELIAPKQDAAHLATHLRGTEPGYLFANALGRLTEAGRKSGRLLAFEDAKLILVVDQFEELFTAAGINPEDRRLFVQLLAGLARSGAVWVIATLRADFWHRALEISELVGLSEGLGRIDLAAATAAELAEIIRKPAQAAGLSFEVHPQTGLGLDAVLAQDAAAAPGALPLLSFTLDELYKNAKARGEMVLTHASYDALGGLEGAIANRADEMLGTLPAAAQAALPQVLRTLTTLSGVEDQTPVGRTAPLAGFAEGSPARILVDAFVAARLLVASGEGSQISTVRLAHEALIGRWDRARDQLAADREFLAWRTGLEAARRGWQDTPKRLKNDALLRGFALKQARTWLAKRSDNIPNFDQDFILRSKKKMLQRRLRTGVAAGLIVAALTGYTAWLEWPWLRERYYALLYTHPLSEQQEHSLNPKADFIECADCPKMVVIPAGSISVGSLDSPDEQPPHTVTISLPFAVAMFELTFAQWDACVNYGDCTPGISDRRWGRGLQPVINVSWKDAQQYVQWLKRITGKSYRLLTEAEWEYAARAGRSTHFSFGNDDAQLDQYAWYAADAERRPHPVGLKMPNRFGLYDMHGNVSEWVEDCYHNNYRDAAADEQAWTAANCDHRVIRGGSWLYRQRMLRSAARDWSQFDKGNEAIGIRVGRSLAP